MLKKLIINNDFPVPGQLSFQDPASPVFEEIINFHNYVFVYMTFIFFGVFWILIELLRNFNKVNRFISHKFMIHGTLIELIWTVTPALVLVGIAFPSFKLLYLMDEVIDPAITIKVVGHQWYWSYEYSDYVSSDDQESTIAFDSYMVPEDDLELGDLRLLEVDNRVVLPKNTHVRVIVTSADVIHSWAVPSLGVKIDAIPGRLNQTSFLAYRNGVFYGQCSEICGIGHSVMPIAIEVVDLENYCTYIDNLIQEAREE
ncbi:cytochrome c oxidase subunit 2 (mitochondrion) [Monosiga brevicollis]|uniref:Cytochrome c oxidase subunit 2 n=1 Tax=Monosiga brevicollis TaxID=81824 RepID=Q8HIT0_MONBE|nr:cytochrome c oxidase subunit 2 [Monosiga brevicollis]AAN28354.1 cytochrome c oxidase subunit 2 [Monosiga brevicollis]|eukprot:NP_696983.1 cytochrome c oxidase subunit 2 (mitochondrion) [Monosiga brevicollis ATCC 50154]